MRRRARTIREDLSSRFAAGKTFQFVVLEHERATASAPPEGREATLEDELADCAGGLEAEKFGRFARREEPRQGDAWLRRALERRPGNARVAFEGGTARRCV